MKQKFRDKIPKGAIRIKFERDGQNDYWYTTGEEITGQIVEVVEYYEEIGINLTNRQLYYQLVGKDLIPNAQEVYKKICKIITDLRYAGIVDWETIEDKAREPKRKAQWNSIADIVESAVKQFRLPRWKDQETYIEMYCEKEAGINVLNPICEKYHIYFGFNKGYSSAAALYDLAKRLSVQIDNGKKVKLLYFGDHDPSGLDMVRDIKERVGEFLDGGVMDNDALINLENEFYENEVQNESGDYHLYQYEEEWKPLFMEEWLPEQITDREFKIIPVSLTMDQIKQFNPPPNPAKITDPRASWYIKEFGKVSWELDAIDAIELRKIAEEEILKHIDIDLYEEVKSNENLMKSKLRKFAIKL